MTIQIKKSTIERNLPNGIPDAVERGGGLKGYALRKGSIDLPKAVLKNAIDYLWNNNEINMEQYETLSACLNSGDYSRVLNNRKVKGMIRIV